MALQRKQYPNPALPPEILAELGMIPMSQEALANMNLNPYDQLFVCRLIRMRDAAIMDEMAEALAEVVAAQNKKMFSSLEEQTKLLTGISLDLCDIKKRLTNDEKRLEALTKKLNTINKRLGAVEKKVDVFECKK